MNDLPSHRKQYGFDNLDFSFRTYRLPHRARSLRNEAGSARLRHRGGSHRPVPRQPRRLHHTPLGRGNPLERRQMRTLLRLSPGRLALAGLFVCLLLVAAGLRFYDLSGHPVWFDEVIAANNSSGALSEVIHITRRRSPSPILYPLALWAAQKVDISSFSIRVLPATASVLTVAVMLILLPRLGVARGAAFLAALLATLSAAAIEHAQDAREYSIDALLAVLMIAGAAMVSAGRP